MTDRSFGSLSTYQPTWRERMAQALLGDGRASPERRRVVEGLLGTSGLGGSLGLNVADVSPIGPILSGHEMGRAVNNGDVGGVVSSALGLIPAVAAGSNGLKTLASKSSNIYNPPMKSARSFAADYPMGALADDAGKLTHSIDGTPLTARYIAGRSEVGGVDRAIPASAFDEIATAGTGAGISRVAQGSLGGDLGRVPVHPITRQPLGVRLAVGANDKVAGHEIGHVIDQVAGEIPTKGLAEELQGVYNSLNNGKRNIANTDAHASAKPFLPQHNGYKSDDIPRELMAEAIRAYMADPNYLKTVAPQAAAAIRKAVNGNEKLRGVIQFNSLGLLASGGLGLGALASSSDQN
jgi:hypothetical protein